MFENNPLRTLAPVDLPDPSALCVRAALDSNKLEAALYLGQLGSCSLTACRMWLVTVLLSRRAYVLVSPVQQGTLEGGFVKARTKSCVPEG